MRFDITSKIKSRRIFNDIYKNGTWGEGSGPGSKIENSEIYLSYMQEFIDSHRVKSILDLGVGDGELLRNLDKRNCKYIGLDVSSVAISLASQKNSNRNIDFKVGDAEFYDYPKVDLIICKDVLQHLPNEKVEIILRKILKSSKFALICNDLAPHENLINSKIEIGGYRPIDLREKPFKIVGTEVLKWNSYGFVKSVLLVSGSSELD
jgi:SAM-dependent methyltransferase